MPGFYDLDGIAYAGDSSSNIDYLYDLLARPDWHRRAACRGVGAGIFYSEHKGHNAEALALCRVCPVINECRAHADTTPERFGIWGAMGTRARRRARRRPRVIAA